MSDSIDWQKKLNEESWQSLCKTICNDCVFHIQVEGFIKCLNPEEMGVNCCNVIFCNSFQPTQEVDSPCVSFSNGEDVNYA
ncbi:MAG: hypothetical protein KME32_05495 [Mojavia pulchra JT2-VF2]|jgi:hypothetical protein|uniref:Uncharacterized protein n=1 Tax=Mojavia pulchra JT2-VF2 TaxID=287848 RepID=A0A951PUP1_9NOST|nr:hypothetical protein [Mojavia pulchra JT2-VF2]